MTVSPAARSMGQGAGRPAVPHLTVAFDDARSHAKAGSWVHGIATLHLPAASTEAPTLRCEV